MKKILQLLWCWLAISLIFLPIQFWLIEMGWEPIPYGAIAAALPAILSALIVFIFARRSPEKWCRKLGIHYISLAMAAAAGILGFFILVAFKGYPQPSFRWGVIPSILIGLALGILVCRKSLWRGVAALLAILLVSAGLVLILTERQKSIMSDYGKKWTSLGISMELKDLFPMHYSKPQCDEWFRKMVFFSEKDQPKKQYKEWKAFYDECIVPLSSDKIAIALAKGEDLRTVISPMPARTDPRWAKYLPLDTQIRIAMHNCPHVQWFNPEEYKDHIWEAPLPSLVSLIRWSRGLLAQSQIEASEGRMDQAQTSLDILHEASGKMLINGQIFTNALIGISMEKLQMMGEVSIIAMSGEPMQTATRSIVEQAACQDLSWFLASLKVELWKWLREMDRPESAPLIGDRVMRRHHWVPISRLYFRSIFWKETGPFLDGVTQTIVYLGRVSHNDSAKYGWAGYLEFSSKASFFMPPTKYYYGRTLALITQARLVLMADEVLKYRKEHRGLPENLDFVQAPWRTDPFTEKPLIYRKEGEKIFVVYSPGPDMRDDGAKNLYVSGAMEFKDEKKEDIGFRIALQ